jgi:hypothetical protein
MNQDSETKRPALPASEKRVWLHVGMHKTGTTSLQSSLGAVRNHPQWRMLKVGGRSNMGKALCAMFAAKPSKHSAFRKLGKTDEEISVEGGLLRERLRKAVASCSVPEIIISAEALTSTIDAAGLAALRDLLLQHCREIRVIGYVRPPVGFKTSIFQEAVKHGKGKFNVAEAKVHYRRRFRKFDDVFGRDKVLLRKFDTSTFPGGCIVADFFEQTGLSPLPPDAVVRTNESLSREACGMLYAYRKFGPGYGVGDTVIRENNEMIAPMFGIAGERLRFSGKLMLPHLTAELKDIRWIERRIGASLHEKSVSAAAGVDTEEGLLTVSRACCLAYAREFESRHGVPVPPERIPTGDPVDPSQIATFLEFCRGLIRAKFATVPPPPKSILHARFRRFMRWLTGKPSRKKKTRTKVARPAADVGSSPAAERN